MKERTLLNECELEQVTGGTGTGEGMARWAMQAFSESWSYVWGGSAPGGVDASGLISSYAGGAPNSEAMLVNAAVKGFIATMPDLPGIGLYSPGHVGVYVGGGMAVSAENEETGVVMRQVSARPWTHWFQIAGVSY